MGKRVPAPERLFASWEIFQAKPPVLRERLASRGVFALRAYGSSMRPHLRPGDWLLLRRESPLRVLSGDVVAFLRQGRIYIHRVVRKQSGRCGPVLITRGDALTQCDSPVTAAELLGRVLAIVRGGRTINLEGLAWPLAERALSLLLRLRARGQRLAATLGRVPAPMGEPPRNSGYADTRSAGG